MKVLVRVKTLLDVDDYFNTEPSRRGDRYYGVECLSPRRGSMAMCITKRVLHIDWFYVLEQNYEGYWEPVQEFWCLPDENVNWKKEGF